MLQDAINSQPTESKVMILAKNDWPELLGKPIKDRKMLLRLLFFSI